MGLNDVFEEKWFIGHLQCPDCRSPLRVGDVDVTCSECNRQLTLRAPVDLRPVAAAPGSDRTQCSGPRLPPIKF